MYSLRYNTYVNMSNYRSESGNQFISSSSQADSISGDKNTESAQTTQSSLKNIGWLTSVSTNQESESNLSSQSKTLENGQTNEHPYLGLSMSSTMSAVNEGNVKQSRLPAWLRLKSLLSKGNSQSLITEQKGVGGRNPLRLVNNLLLVVLVLINGYVILTPLLPQILYSDTINTEERKQLEQAIFNGRSVSDTVDGQDPKSPLSTAQNIVNSVIIPSLVLDQPIIEGQNSVTALRKGVWRWPGSSTPDKGGNTVLAGHRFTYNKPQGAFYFLDKVKINDMVGVIWDNKTYLYKIIDVKTVSTSQTAILGPTAYPRLTLYTCTPLWNPKDRLVVVGELQKEVNL